MSDPSTLLKGLLEPLPPVDPRPALSKRNIRKAIHGAVPSREASPSASPSNSRFVARSNAKSRPSKLETKGQSEPPLKPRRQIFATSIVGGLETATRSGGGGSSGEPEPQVHSPTKWKARRGATIFDASDDEISDAPRRSPKKRPVYQSSDDEKSDKFDGPPTKAMTRTGTIVISDSEDEMARKTSSWVEVDAPKYHVPRTSSVENVEQLLRGARDEREIIVPETQQDESDGSDDAGVLKDNSPSFQPGGLKAQRIPSFPQAIGIPRRSLPRAEASPGWIENFESLPDEMTEASPRKIPPESMPVRSMGDGDEIIEISSDEDADEISHELPWPPMRRSEPISEQITPSPRTQDIIQPPLVTATPKKRGKAPVRGNATPTSPSGKAMSKTAMARLLQHYAQELFDELNVNVFENALDGCALIWSKLLSSTAGKALLKKHREVDPNNPQVNDGAISYSLTIELSTKVVDSEERVRNTLSHEMCHLSTWLIDGVGNPDHGTAWKKWASKVMRFRKDIEISTRHTYEIAYKFSWECTNANCGHVYGRFTRSIDITKQGCGLCRAVLKPLFDINPRKSGWQDFMKQNLKAVKAANPGMSQSAVMQELARRWRETKQGATTEGMADMVAGLGKLQV